MPLSETQPSPPETKSQRRLRQYEEALAHWRQVDEQLPGDAQAAQRIARLIVERSRWHALWKPSSQQGEELIGRDSQSSPPESLLERLKKEPLPTVLPGQTSGIKRTPTQQLEAGIRDNPSNPDNYLWLTVLYLDKGRDFDAERMLAKGRNEADDPRVQELWEEVTMLRVERRLAVARQNAAVDKSPEVQTILDDLHTEQDHLEIEVYQNRTRREPDNASHKLQLGRRLKRAGKSREALRRFEEALVDDDERPAAAYELGLCREHEREYPAALQQYRLSIDSATEPEQRSTRKLAAERASALARQMKLEKLAERYTASDS